MDKHRKYQHWDEYGRSGSMLLDAILLHKENLPANQKKILEIYEALEEMKKALIFNYQIIITINHIYALLDIMKVKIALDHPYSDLYERTFKTVQRLNNEAKQSDSTLFLVYSIILKSNLMILDLNFHEVEDLLRYALKIAQEAGLKRLEEEILDEMKRLRNKVFEWERLAKKTEFIRKKHKNDILEMMIERTKEMMRRESKQ